MHSRQNAQETNLELATHQPSGAYPHRPRTKRPQRDACHCSTKAAGAPRSQPVPPSEALQSDVQTNLQSRPDCVADAPQQVAAAGEVAAQLAPDWAGLADRYEIGRGRHRRERGESRPGFQAGAIED